MVLETDILLTGVTGFVGRFILRELLERCPKKRIAVIIRSSGKTTAQQRWANEIVGSSLFANHSEILQGIRVIDAALENMESTTHQITRAHSIIHCAANIKHYDPYEALERDNVGNVERIMHLAESLHCQHLILLSTCYVHPRHATERAPVRAPVRIAGVQRTDFYNDYCYTKWLGEEAVHTRNTTIPNITIARLSCVGAPSKWELAAHPCSAQAHLGILSLALRGYLETLAWRPSARIATIPVDIVANHIVSILLNRSDAKGIDIQQLCAPPEFLAYHISLPLLVSTLQSEFGLEDFRGLTRADSRGDHLVWWKQVAYSCMKRGRQSLLLHTHVQDFVSTFTDEDIRFESSLKPDMFPVVTEHDVARETCAYAVRILHHRQLAKGLPISRLDQFWHRVANREPVQICMRLAKGVLLEDWPQMELKMWTFFMSYRKYTAGLSNASPLDGPITWKQLAGHSCSTYFSPPQNFLHSPGKSEDQILSFGLHQAATNVDRLWGVTPVLDPSGSHVSYILIRGDHSLTDGVGGVNTLPDMSEHVFEEKVEVAGFHAPRSISLWMDVWLGFVYVALLAIVLWSSPAFSEEGRSKEPTIATETMSFVRPPDGMTFTADLLWKLTQYFTGVKRESAHIFAVPAMVTGHRPAKDMPTNEFVPILLPVDGGMSREAFAHRCLLLRARSVRFLSWCLVQLLEWGVWDEIRDVFLGRVRCIVSSFQTGQVLPAALESIHIVTTTPSPIPFCVTAITGRDKVFLTVRSHDPRVHATDIAQSLVHGKI